MTATNESTQIAIPDALTASVRQETQYGMEYPDGSVIWNTVPIVHKHKDVYVQRIAEGENTARDWWREHLDRSAKEAKVNPVDYSNGHKIVTRIVVLSVTATIDHPGNLRPWGQAEPEVPVPMMKAPAAPPWG